MEKLYEDFSWLMEQTGYSRNSVKAKITVPFRKELEDTIIKYPSKTRRKYVINARKMREWLNDNFERIDWGS